MLGQRDPQASIFDGDQLYLEHVGARTFYGFLAQHRHELFRDEDFAGLYHDKLGRPSVPPSLLCTSLLLQSYDGCSDAEARDRAAYDHRWKLALGVGDLEKPFTKSTLQLFRAQLLLHEKARVPFERSLALARKTGFIRSHGKLRAAVDTTHILGRGAVRDTYNLIGDGIVSVARLVAKLSGQKLEQWAQEHELSAYVGSSLKGEANIDWSSEAEKEALLTRLAADAERVLEIGERSCEGFQPEDGRRERIEQASAVLRQVLMQDMESQPNGGKRIHRGTSAERICSVHDPEMRHGRKSGTVRFDGHKAAVAADVETGLVMAVGVKAGSAKDEEGSLELAQEAAANTGLELEAVLGDCAYGSGPNRQRFNDAGIEMQAKVPKPMSGDFFSKDRFDIDLEEMTCHCPAGQVTSHLYKSGYAVGTEGARVPVRSFRFAASVCSVCPLRSECFAPGKKGRTIEVRPHEALIQAARRWQTSAEFDDFRRRRQVVEHRIARLLQLGIRQARYFGRSKTLFQLLQAAAVANLTQVAGLGNGQPTKRALPRALSTVLLTSADLLGRFLATLRRFSPGLGREPCNLPPPSHIHRRGETQLADGRFSAEPLALDLTTGAARPFSYAPVALATRPASTGEGSGTA